MLRTERGLALAQRLGEKQRGLRLVATAAQQQGEVLAREGGLGMRVAQGAVEDRESAALGRFRSLRLAAFGVQRSEVLQVDAGLVVLRS